MGHKATYSGIGVPTWWGPLALAQSASPLIRYWLGYITVPLVNVDNCGAVGLTMQRYINTVLDPIVMPYIADV